MPPPPRLSAAEMSQVIQAFPRPDKAHTASAILASLEHQFPTLPYEEARRLLPHLLRLLAMEFLRLAREEQELREREREE